MNETKNNSPKTNCPLLNIFNYFSSKITLNII
jgi:hypothetical protein